MLILGLPVGGAIGEAGLRASQRKRGRQSGVWAAVGSVGGGIIGLLAVILIRFGSRLFSIPVDTLFRLMFGNIGTLLFIGIVAFAVYSRFKVRI